MFKRKVIRELLKVVEQSGEYNIGYDTIFKEGIYADTLKELDQIIVRNIFKKSSKKKVSKREKFERAITHSKEYKEWIESCGEHGKTWGTLYVVRLKNNYESFIKVGITTTSLDRRFRDVPYGYEVLATEKVYSVKKLYLLEQHLHRRLVRYRYTPKQYFSGYTECYRDNIEKVVLLEIKKYD